MVMPCSISTTYMTTSITKRGSYGRTISFFSSTSSTCSSSTYYRSSPAFTIRCLKNCTWNRIDTLFDCAIIGGGPAGLNAALILGRAKRNAILFDNNNPRNAVTRDGIKPKEFREMAHKEI